MWFAAWVVGIALLAMMFNNYLENRDNPNRNLTLQVGPDGLAQVVLTRNRAGHYVGSGAINEHPVVFLLDTGATTVSLPMDLARKLSLPLQQGGMSRTANGMVQTFSTRLDSVDLGGLKVTNLRATVMPNLPGGEVLLGMDFLKRFDLIQRGETLTIRLTGYQ